MKRSKGIPARRPVTRRVQRRQRRSGLGLRSVLAFSLLIALAVASVYLYHDHELFAVGRHSALFARLFPGDYFLNGQRSLNAALVAFLKDRAGVRESDVSERRIGMADRDGRYEKIHWRISWRGGLSLSELSKKVEALSSTAGFRAKSRRIESRQWGDYLYLELSQDGRVSHSLLVTVERRRLEPEEILGTRQAGVPELPYRVAIVIDDVGYDLELARKFIALDAPLAFSVLPFLSESVASAEEAHAAGREVMVHMPMEPREYPKEDPGPGAILRSMDPEDVRASTLNAIAEVPYAIGLNNHMGSRITTDPILIGMVLRTVKERGLFFLDSRTTATSVAYNMARRLGLRTASRNVFLDDVFDPYYVDKMIEELLATARREGTAIAIGHLNPITYEALRTNLWKANRYGVRLVPVSELVE